MPLSVKYRLSIFDHEQTRGETRQSSEILARFTGTCHRNPCTCHRNPGTAILCRDAAGARSAEGWRV